MKDRLRNRFFRWIGVTPDDDFIEYNEDVMKVLESFEQFVKASSSFCNIVAGRLGIKYDGKNDIVEEVGKSEETIEEEYRERGMI